MPGRLIETPGTLIQERTLLEDAPRLPPRERILLADPTHYDVTREDNPHTVQADGTLNTVNPDEARDQWEALKRAFSRHGFTVDVLPPQAGLPDLVFCCNTAWPYLEAGTGTKRSIPARMRHEGRQGEVPLMQAHLERLGYEPSPLPKDAGCFEAGGDLQWLGDTRILLAGAGPRTDASALDHVARIIDAPVIKLDLVDEAFYHLDTCLAALDDDHVAIVPNAFSKTSQALLEALPVSLVPLPEEEARKGFAANLHCPDGEHVLIDEANPQTIHRLEGIGYTMVPLPTGEFRKAGGSVFCMTNQAW